jgi:hypothetical protein
MEFGLDLDMRTISVIGILYTGVVSTIGLFFHFKHIKRIMAKLEQFEAIIDRIDARTSEIAEELRILQGQISGQGLPAEVEEVILSRLSAVADKLDAVGKEEVEEPEEEEPEDKDDEVAADEA